VVRVIDAALPAGPAGRDVVRGVAACLASVLEVPVAHLPVPDGDLPGAIGVWRTWLAGHGSGLVPVADPTRFQWPGWWIAVTADGQAVLAFGTPPGVVLSPQAPELLGRATADLPVTGAWVVAPLDPVLRTTSAIATTGVVEAVALATGAGTPMRRVASAHARAARGLDGDRYATGAGTFGPRTGPRNGYDLTLVAAEALDALAAAGRPVTFEATRRNVLTRGVDLDALLGRELLLGDVRCRARRRCEPCARLEQLSGPGVLRPLIHRGGLRVDVLTDGEVRAGSPVTPA
jgi:MOSC domain-containing protein YiiM